ncbi:MAG: hypothetical protein HOP28_02680, partial [Gemmatimonadales bacterium]|nr:hypothetical protein [Gemmatimonadales bacterium]
AVWAVDRSSGQAWRVAAGGALGTPRPVNGLDRAAADGDRLWWTTGDGTVLRDFERTVELGVPARDRGAITVCAGSVWVSGRDLLMRVGTWGAEKGSVIPAPGEPLPFLVCSGGVLVGASKTGKLLVLDPSSDADARLVDASGGGPVGALVALGGTAWVFAAEHAEARLITVRGG